MLQLLCVIHLVQDHILYTIRLWVRRESIGFFKAEHPILEVSINNSILFLTQYKFKIEPSYGMIKENHPGPGTYGQQGNEINKFGKY